MLFRSDPKTLAKRLLASKIDRPLIKGKSKDELAEFIAHTLDKRNQFYKKARYQITKPDMTVDEIMKMIKSN